jgi:hypothetical protein
MLENLEASLVQLDYIDADLAQDPTSQDDIALQELHTLRQKMRAARCAVEIAIEIFSDLERAQGARRVAGRAWTARRSWNEPLR